MRMGIKENLVRLRTQAKKSQPGLAKEAGVSQQLISQLENGKNLTTKRLPEIARALQVSVFEIDENYSPENAEPGYSAPLVSWVNAGQLLRPEAVEDLEDAKRVSAPGLDPKGTWIALEVVGDSMDRISPPESILFVNLKERKLVPNACYIITDDEGGSSYKRYRDRPGRWEPVSTNPKHKTFKITDTHAPKILGRVRKSLLSM